MKLRMKGNPDFNLKNTQLLMRECIARGGLKCTGRTFLFENGCRFIHVPLFSKCFTGV